MDDDPYAFCYQIEKDVTKAFDKAGRIVFEKLARSRFEAAPSSPSTTVGAGARCCARSTLHREKSLPTRRWPKRPV